MSMKRCVLGLFVLVLTTLGVGCDSSGYRGGVDPDPFADAWHDAYGNVCGGNINGAPSPGCNYYSTGGVSHQYYYQYGTWEYTDYYGNTHSKEGWVWVTPNGITPESAFNTADDETRDTLTQQAVEEKKVVLRAGKKLAEKYALANETGVHIATTLNAYATLIKYRHSRARTANDVAEFTRKLYGVEMEQAIAALNQAGSGDLSGVKSLNDDVAVYWGTSPETSARILKSFYKKHLSEVFGR